MTPPSGQLTEDEEREPTITPAIPEGGVYEVKFGNRRTNVLRLLPNGHQHKKLLKLADVSAKLFNEINYERRQQFFNEGKVDFKGTWGKYYEKYKNTLGVNAQAVMQKNNEAWSSFFSLLKLKKEGKLPHMDHVSPPRYWKDRENKKRKRILMVRQDRYEVDEERKKLILKDFHMEIDFEGRLRWYGKQGRLEIIYDEDVNKWYVHIPVDVGVETTKRGKQSKHVVHGERKSIQVVLPQGNKVASIDLGVNILASVIVDDGTWLLYKGVRAKEDYFYFEGRIAEVQSLADKARSVDEYEAYEELTGEKRRLFEKLQRRFLHLYRALASGIVEELHKLGVSTIYLGYPYNISQDRGNKYTVNVWSYRKLIEAIELKAQEYGMRVYEVVEYNTSRFCVYHNVEVTRKPRGVVYCSLGHKLHSDLNGALNILRKGTGKIINSIKKPLSFIVDHNRIAPIKGSNALDPSRTLAPFRTGGGWVR
ncbi:ISC1476 family transposase [Saccharolobus shibatae B12]|uniref:ISC1476 family transposase n=1 Tax=Saccharolobus shibatae (strain ATCC 51178 / DSM 5389 / JCM 8931 / NBRC 15437 / B12) TaxID=523848 RepID=A0A8F5BQP6_SACSH|nr:RNA-guided endonuclease TnpB family protein [Saccharolobus shibatae]QXJ29543.1 ISC1476 family transposase [Saccharolobus shibatae B12]